MYIEGIFSHDCIICKIGMVTQTAGSKEMKGTSENKGMVQIISKEKCFEKQKKISIIAANLSKSICIDRVGECLRLWHDLY